jgi:4-alpha-glucanotransferase
MAGNPLLISPEYLQTMGLLDETDLNAAMQPNHGLVDYISVETKKQQLLEKAWRNFSLDETYRSFCERENDWLHDFALFTVLRELNNDRSWVDWDTKYRDRNKEALAELFNQQKEKIDFIKWQQYIFYSQWEELRRKANLLGITLIGDLPFYVSYDSADVWSNRSIFKLDAEGKMLAMAGVPPDAFSEDGQLWGMPVFDWEKLTETGFKWWVQRLKKNIQLFDLIRLDHFRAFSAYWEVPARETTAKNGKWVNAPGEAFFNNMQQELEGLPFIAEDLGDIDQAVRDLRDQFKLPGMKVLQFAYSDDIGRSEFLPHQFKSNFVVYTGTHDNNTSRGWWENEADADTRSRVEAYAGKKLSPGEIADELCRSAYASVADLCIIPVQDILGLGEEARTNRPSSTENNWSWRLVPGQLDAGVERKLRQWTRLFNR